MLFKDAPIQKKMMMAMLITSGAVVLLTCLAFFTYEVLTFRQTTIRQLSTLGKIIASNSTAALAFKNVEDANEILLALKAEPHIVTASLYDAQGNLFARYPENYSKNAFPQTPYTIGFDFNNSHIEGFLPVSQGDKYLGALYLKSDMEAVYDMFLLYSLIALFIILLSFWLAYFLSKYLQSGISKPILALADTAKAISERHDYSVRAEKLSTDEIGSLTDAFNHMLLQIEQQNAEINSFNEELAKKNKMLQTLQYVSRVISGELEHQKVVQVIVEAITSLTGAEYGAFFYNKKDRDLQIFETSTAKEEHLSRWNNLGFFRQWNLLETSLNEKKVVRYDDLTKISRDKLPFSVDNDNSPVKSLLATPVASKSGEIVGGLVFGHSMAGKFTKDAENILQDISPQAAIALDNARLYEESNIAKQQVEEQRNVLYNIFNKAPSLICLCKGRDFVYEFVNREYEQQLQNYNLVGKSLREYLVEKGRQDFINVIDYVYQTGETYNSKEVAIERKENDRTTLKYFDIIIQALRNEKREIEGVIAYATDISEQVYARKTIEEFMSVASHELKTPLTTVMAYSELLEEEVANRNSRDANYIVKMNANLNKLNSLISDLLDVSRIRSGKMHFINEKINFDDFVKESIENIKYTHKTHHILLSGATRAVIYGDRERLEQAIANIVSNATKYSPKGTEVLVDLKKENENVKISFTDFGMGIPEEKMKYLFQRFYRIEEKGTSGLGIGLYITKEIIDRHNGKIEVTSNENVGTTFTLTLPLTQEK